MRCPLAGVGPPPLRRLTAAAAFLVPCVLGSLATAARAVDRADSQYRFAMALARRGDFGRAADELRAFVEEFPQDERRTKAGFWLGYFLHKADRFEEAAEALREWTAANRTHELADRAHYWRAESLAAAGRTTEARLEWREVASRFPTSPRAANALESLAWSHFDGGEHERALEYAREVRKRFPGRKKVVGKAARLAGQCLLELGRPGDALAEFDSLLARPPGGELETRARFGRAAALQELGRHEDAAAEYAEVVKLAREDADLKALAPQAMLHQASSLVSAGKADEALRVIQKLTYLPDRGVAGVKALFWKGLAYEAKGRKAEASAAYAEALSRPEAGSVHGRAAFKLAKLRCEAGDKLGAVAAYDRVVALGDPAELVDHSLYDSAVTLDELGRTEEALSRVERLLWDRPESPLRADALFAAGEFLVRLERYREAAASYGEFLRRFATHERALDVRFRRAWCLNASGQAEAARAELEGLLRTEPAGEHAADAAFLLGESARKDGRLDDAERAYAMVIGASPESERAAEALWALASLANRRGRTELARKYAGRLADEHPASPLLPWAGILAADIALADGRTAEALAAYRSVRADFPGHELEPAALSGEAWALLNSGARLEAREAFQALAHGHPGSRYGIEALYRSAVLLREEGRAAEAEAALTELLRLDPEGRFAHAALLERAVARKSSGDLDGAVAELEGFMRDFPDSSLLPEVLSQLALAYFEKKDHEAERAAWRRLLEGFPDSLEAFGAHYGLGALAESVGDWETAARQYGLASAFGAGPDGPPEAADAALRRAECLLRLGRKAEAWRALSELADAFPGTDEAPKALARAGELALARGDYRGAIPLLQRAERLSPGSGALFLSEALRASGRHEEALSIVETYLEAARPDDPARAKMQLALAQAALGRLAEAEPSLQEVVAEAEDSLAARAQYELGEIYFRTGRLKDADRAFYQVVLLYPFEEWKAKGRFRLGETNERLGESARARDFYAELVRENPDSPLVPQARERLKALGP